MTTPMDQDRARRSLGQKLVLVNERRPRRDSHGGVMPFLRRVKNSFGDPSACPPALVLLAEVHGTYRRLVGRRRHGLHDAGAHDAESVVRESRAVSAIPEEALAWRVSFTSSSPKRRPRQA